MPMTPSLRPKPADALAVLAVIALAGALLLLTWGRETGGALTAEICVDGRAAETVRLDRLSGPEERVLTANGYTLTLTLFPDGAEMTHADCPTQDCVRTGRVTRPGQSIVCLPARVSVTLAGRAEDGVDAVLG